ncbi:MAG: class B sortase [Lachnospiraceae bacterium]|nr:class B sortase [Lachnospiraceae bacterium]
MICIPTFCASSYYLCDTLLRYRAEDQANALIAQPIQEIREQPESESKAYDIFTEYEALWEQNHDFAGWLYIDDTRIDYPVMHTPDDPEYYLHRAFDRSDANSGSLFIDGSYSADGNSLLIHGHHMKDKSMFGSLTDYKSYDFAATHSVIHFDTLTEERNYEVLAAFYWDPSYSPETEPFRYYEYSDLSSQEIFDEYISQIRACAIYDTGVSVSYGDHILTLSTCNYHANNGRFVVVAVSN